MGLFRKHYPSELDLWIAQNMSCAAEADNALRSRTATRAGTFARTSIDQAIAPPRRPSPISTRHHASHHRRRHPANRHMAIITKRTCADTCLKENARAIVENISRQLRDNTIHATRLETSAPKKAEEKTFATQHPRLHTWTQ